MTHAALVRAAEQAVYDAAQASLTPCGTDDPRVAGMWTDEDHNARQMAAKMCQECPVRRSCLTVGKATGGIGVYGGEDLTGQWAANAAARRRRNARERAERAS